MFNSSNFALIIITEDLLFVTSIIGKASLSVNEVLIERAIGLSDFKILLDELIKEGFSEIKILVDPKISFDEYFEIEKYSKITYSEKKIKLYQEHDFLMLI